MLSSNYIKKKLVNKSILVIFSNCDGSGFDAIFVEKTDEFFCFNKQTEIYRKKQFFT